MSIVLPKSIILYNSVSHSCVTDSKTPAGAAAVEAIAAAVTHARFVGTDPESDEVVLMKILYVSSHEKFYWVGWKNVFLLSFIHVNCIYEIYVARSVLKNHKSPQP